MKKGILLFALLILKMSPMMAQQADTVTVELARTSKVVFTIQDKRDLEQLKHYDFDALFDDILSKLSSGDTLSGHLADTTWMYDAPESAEKDDDDDWGDDEGDDWGDDDEDNDDWDEDWNNDDKCNHADRKVWHSMNFDFGINNYLEDGAFPDYNGAQYTVKPWGSWYVGINSILNTDFGDKWSVQWGFGVSWYNFKFEDERTRVTDTETGVTFTEDPRPFNFNKSKLEATYLNVSIIPMYSFGSNHHHGGWWHDGHESFRIGIGPYAGYRVESHSKQVYEVDGDKEVDKEKDNFYLNNFRYGIKLQMGTQGIEFFTAYDLNPLFASGKGPDLHAITFGIVF
jgi:hypothetical protein